jgi:hypothetical protein
VSPPSSVFQPTSPTSVGPIAPSSPFAPIKPPVSSSASFGQQGPSSSAVHLSPSSSFGSIGPSSPFVPFTPPTASTSFGGLAPPSSSTALGQIAPPSSSTSFGQLAPPSSSATRGQLVPPTPATPVASQAPSSIKTQPGPTGITSPFSPLAPRPEDQALITINSVSTSGSGCPSGTVSVSISTDRTVVTLGFDDFHLAVGVSFTPQDADKNCQILLSLAYPPGYTYSVLETTYHGFAQLDAGVTGTIEAEYTFADDRGRAIVFGDIARTGGGNFSPGGGGGDGLMKVTTNSVITGGAGFSAGATFTVNDEIPLDQRVPSPCGGENVNLLVRTHISLDTTRGNGVLNGVLTDEDATFALTQQVHVAWEKCD